jgi:hypothetical protein
VEKRGFESAEIFEAKLEKKYMSEKSIIDRYPQCLSIEDYMTVAGENRC